MKLRLTILTLFLSVFSFAQSTVSGTVTDDKNVPLVGVTIKVVGENNKGTTTDFEGKFKFSNSQKPPYYLSFSYIGTETKKVAVDTENKKMTVVLNSATNQLNEIVFSASRTPERIVESPVTIERMSLQQIKNTTAPTFYDGLENLKEVHFNTSSLGFKTVNTRGFAAVGNTRFLQLVDGMDNAAPALNFVLGNLIGLSDLDVANVELLPGASSALYGANAFNGVLFMNSKNPFTTSGISTYFKYGQTNQEIAGTNGFYDLGVRFAHKFSPYFAAKLNFNYLTATDWIAGDFRDSKGGAIGHALNQNYDGINLYGDEASTFITNVGQVSRTGYREQDLYDNKVKSLKTDISLHFRPFANDFEVIAQYKMGKGNTIYQGSNRYALKDFQMDQVRVEMKAKNFFVRSYVTFETSGNAYDMRFAALNVNRAAKSDLNWFTDYGKSFQLSQAVLGLNANEAAAYARNFADNNVSTIPGLFPNGNAPTDFTTGKRFEVGTDAFNNALANVIKVPSPKGARFKDKSALYHTDVNYNFKDLIDFAEVQVGGSFRQYQLNSQGTIFTDYDGAIKYSEVGAYSQLTKKLLDERLKFTGSIRYDKGQNFDGSISPRISLVYAAGARKNNVIRVSFQTGFRNPTAQDQYIGLDAGPFALIGSAPDNLSRYKETLPVSAAGQQAQSGANPSGVGAPANVNLSGLDAYNNSYTVPSVQKFGITKNPLDLAVATPGLVKPEQVKAFELGYKTIIGNDFSFDVNGYYNLYNDFLNTARVITPYYGKVGTDFTNLDTQKTLAALANKDSRVYQVYTNSKTDISSLGFGVGVTKKVYKDFEVGANYNYAEFKFDEEKDPAFIPGFNTPKHRAKFSLGNAKLFKNFGFNTNVRWSTSYLWQAPFADGTIPEITVLDAQLNYAIPSFYNSVLKVGATNIGGKDYVQVIGSGSIGQQMFVSFTFNP